MSLESRCIFFICPSENWGTLEQGVLRDIDFVLSEGAHVIFYGLKDSFLDLKISKYNVERFHYSGKRVTRFFDLHFYLDLKKILMKEIPHVVHTYDLGVIGSVCLALRQKPLVPLICSENKKFLFDYNTIFHKLFLARCDLILCPSNEVIRHLSEQFPVRESRFDPIGLGYPVINYKREILKDAKESYIIGTNVDNHLEGIEKYFPLLYAIKALNEGTQSSSMFKLTLYAEKEWGQHILREPLKEKVKELGFESLVTFSEFNPLTYFQEVDLWFLRPDRELLKNILLCNIEYCIPTLIPRRTTDLEMIRKVRYLVETYEMNDAREVRRKLIKIFGNYLSYQENLSKYQDQILEPHRLQGYYPRLLKSYHLSLAKRLRLFRKKRKVRKSE